MDLLSRLKDEVLVGDGATGTELIRLGAPKDVPGELLALTDPDLVAQVHASYAEAGSDLVVTNTFGGHPIKLDKVAGPGRVTEINRAAAAVARGAVPGSVLVGGDIGPTGQILKPHGPGDPDVVLAGFREQAEALAAGGVDFLMLETFFDLREALLALEAATDTGLPVVASMTFDVRPRGVFTLMGDRAADCAKALADAGALVVGANCSVTAGDMVLVGRALAAGTDGPLILQPNAGKPEIEDGKTVYRETPEQFAAKAREMVDAGARIVGGCCGTTPAFIRALKDAVRRIPRSTS